MLTSKFGRILDQLDACPWGGVAGHAHVKIVAPQRPKGLYTPEQRRRRDATKWTLVQGLLAPAQFAVFLVSAGLVLRFLATGEGEEVAIASVVFKTVVLYGIMITGSIWERVVFGRYLFAPAFYWEDMVSMVVMALHTAYIAALLTGALGTHQLMLLALAAYCTYVVNAAQYIVKLRMARREAPVWAEPSNTGLRA